MNKAVGKTALYAREQSFMKDMPAFLVASLASRNDVESRHVSDESDSTSFHAQPDPTEQYELRDALQDAMEHATQNVPAMGKVYVAVDVSGSMGSPVTGYQSASYGRRPRKQTSPMLRRLHVCMVVQPTAPRRWHT